ncbi:MAG: tetratricopeptide repeat protein [Phycisphaerae bacterium]
MEPDAKADKTAATEAAGSAGPGALRKWAFRLIAMTVIPAAFFLLLELALRLGGFGFETAFFVKLDTEIDGRQAYTTNQKFAWRFFPPTGARPPVPARFPAAKPAGAYRIFVFGGSAAMGSPEPSFSFPRILEAMLRERYPGVRFEVVNAAMEAMNSHVARAIALEAAEYDGDLFIVYLGNNEVVGPYGLSDTFAGFSPSLATIRTSMWVKTTRLGQLIGRAVRHVRQGGRVEVWKGMETFVDNYVAADDPRLEKTCEHFHQNLLDIIAAARDGSAEVILCTVATNLRDCAPFHSVHRRDLAAADRRRWQELHDAGIALAGQGRHAQAVEKYLAAARVDDRFAELHYRLGHAYLAGERFDEAREHFILARDLDALRFRADTQVNRVIRRTAAGAAGQGVHFVDAERAAELGDANSHGLIGRELFHEHVHMTFKGNYTIAAAVFDKVVGMLPKPVARRSTGGPGPLPIETCERLLAFTGWERYRLASSMERITARPPFTFQLDHATWQAARRADIERLRRFTLPEARTGTLAVYRAAIERDEDDLLLRANLALCLQNFRDHAEAAEQWRALLRRLPGNAQVHKSFGLGLIEAGRLDEAIEQLSISLDIMPRDLDARSNLGVAWLLKGETDQAVLLFRQVLDAYGDHADARTNLAIALARQGQLEQAAEQFATVLRDHPDHVGALRNLAKLLTRRDKTDEAIARFREALSVREDYAIHMDLAALLAGRNEHEEAMRHYRRAVELAPHVAVTHMVAGQALLARQQYADALGPLERAVQLDDRLADAHRDLGIVLQRLGRPDRAVTHYAKAVALNPGDWVSREHLAHALLLEGKYAEAVGHYEKVLAAQPTRAGAHNNIAVALSKLDRLREAVIHFAAAVKLEPTAPRHYNLATRLVRLGQDREAVVHFRRALARRPAWPEAMSELAWVLATSDEESVRNGGEAVRLAQMACKFTKFSQPDVLDALAAAQAEVGQFDEAVATAQKAHDLAEAAGQRQMAERIALRIKLYQSRKPCRRGAREIR